MVIATVRLLVGTVVDVACSVVIVRMLVDSVRLIVVIAKTVAAWSLTKSVAVRTTFSQRRPFRPFQRKLLRWKLLPRHLPELRLTP